MFVLGIIAMVAGEWLGISLVVNGLNGLIFAL